MAITVLVNRGVVARKDALRELHHLSARKELEQEYRWRDDVLAGKQARTLDKGGIYTPLKYIQDPQSLRQTRDEFKRNYERGLPIQLSPTARNELWKRAKLLKDKFKVGMVPKNQMHPVKHTTIISDGRAKKVVVADYDALKKTKAIERNVAWEKRNAKIVSEFKNIMRHLEPDNPDIANIERFRPER